MIYVKSNTGNVVRLLAFIASILVVLVLGICILVIFGNTNKNSYFLDESGEFYYSIHNQQATLDLWLGTAAEYEIKDSVNHGGKIYPLTTIGATAFNNRSFLTKIVIPDSVTTLAGDLNTRTGAFSGCTKLAAIEGAGNVARFGPYSFKNCLSLQALYLPASVQFVDAGAFQGCLGLSQMTINSNGQFQPTCWEQCPGLQTLTLAPDVQLQNKDDLRQALASLNNLTNFVLPDNDNYQVVTTATGTCVVGDAGTTLLLGGCGAGIPNGVRKIADWAFGNRFAAENIYLTSPTIETVAANAFGSGVIYTNASHKPPYWTTNLPIRYEAQLVDFINAQNLVVPAYVYCDPQGQIQMPDYQTLFDPGQDAAPFKQWGAITTAKTCTAQYLPTDTADAATQAALLTLLTQGQTYLQDHDLRLRFTLDFWENFKMAMFQAESIRANLSEVPVYQVTVATAKLQKYCEPIAAVCSQQTVDHTILESTNWRVGLPHLIDAVTSLDPVDLAVTPTNQELWQKLDWVTESAQKYLALSTTDDTKGHSIWLELRNDYESLVVDLTALQTVIVECQSLVAAQYTALTWQGLLTAVQDATMVGPQNLTVSEVRRNLIAAKNNLRESAVVQFLPELDVWLDVCGGLNASNYPTGNFNFFVQQVNQIAENYHQYRTVTAITGAIKNLRSAYDDLTPLAQTPQLNNNHHRARNVLPFFIVALILFTIAVIVQAVAAGLNRKK